MGTHKLGKSRTPVGAFLSATSIFETPLALTSLSQLERDNGKLGHIIHYA
jgi:hypothetical protein